MVVRRTVNAVVASSTLAPRANVRYRSKDGHQTVNLVPYRGGGVRYPDARPF